MTRALSARTNLENVRKEARHLLHSLRQHDATALKRYHSLDSLNGSSAPSLAEAQYVIAREYGCPSWKKLQDRLHKHARIDEAADPFTNLSPSFGVATFTPLGVS
jgi:hypothetical protein